MPSTEVNTPVIHVAVGAIVQEGSVLLAKRAAHQHQGGLWEFPGGKVEQGEQVTDALARELREELAIVPTQFTPLIQIRHDYGDKAVLLDVWVVSAFTGKPVGQEGQPLQWVAISELANYPFPAANQAIVKALTLPTLIAITPSSGTKEDLLAFCKRAIDLGADGLQLRAPQLIEDDIWWLHSALQSNCAIALWVNSCHLWDDEKQCLKQELIERATGVHLRSSHLAALLANATCLPASTKSVTASCHSQAELALAEQLGVDACYLSPVNLTKSHPEAPILGWASAGTLIGEAKVPIYMLGGMALADLPKAKNVYAQGIAGISLFG